MSAVDKIFDAVEKAGGYILLQDDLAKKSAQLKSVKALRCGNCFHWMKSSCIPEKERKEFKSCNSMACRDFKLSDPAGLIGKFENELEAITKQIIILTAN